MVADLTLSIRFPVNALDADDDETGMAWQQAVETLEGFRDLSNGWDGNGADPPVQEIISAAVTWLKQMPLLDHRAIPPTQIVPGSLGEVLFVWQSESQFIEAEIEHPEVVEWMVKVGDAEPEFCSTPVGRAVVLASEEMSAVSG